jgi:hypothetical protein
MRGLVLATVAVALLVATEQASACSCVALDEKQRLRDPAWIGVVGRVTYVGKPNPAPDGTVSSGAPIKVVVRVTRSYRRAVRRTLRVYTSASSASCGVETRAGRKIALFVTRSRSGRYSSNLCMQSSPGELDAAARALGMKARAPKAGTAAVRIASCR